MTASIQKIAARMIGVVALLSISAGMALAEGKIGLVDSQRIFAEYQDAIDAEAIFQQEMEGWQNELGDLEIAIRQKEEQIRSQSLLLSKEKLDELQSEAAQMISDYEAKKAEIVDPTNGKAVLRNQELSAPINDQINLIVEQIGTEDGFDIIIDVATVNVVFSAEGVNITDRVLAELESAGN